LCFWQDLNQDGRLSVSENPLFFKRGSNPAGRTKIITGTYDLIVSACFVYRYEVVKKFRNQTPKKHTVGV